MSPRIICKTIFSTDLTDFDQKVSFELNDTIWNNFTYKLVFIQDEHAFYAHIVFTEIMSYCDLKDL
jgi:hypothetical protein